MFLSEYFFIELDAMTMTKMNQASNPVITVPLNKGVQRNQRVSEDSGPLSPTEYHKIQIPLYKGMPNLSYQNQRNEESHTSQEMRPPVPVRTGSYLFHYFCHF